MRFPNLSVSLIYLLLGMLIKDELLAYIAFTLYTTIPYKGDLLYDHCLRIIAYGTLNMPFHVYQHRLTCKFYSCHMLHKAVLFAKHMSLDG